MHNLGGKECASYFDNGADSKDLTRKVQASADFIRDLNPLLQLGDSWFKFNVYMLNSQKIAFHVTETNKYTEYPVKVTWQAGAENFSVPYGTTTTIREKLSTDELTEFSANSDVTIHSTEMGFEVGPNQNVNFEYNSAWQICTFVLLDEPYAHAVLVAVYLSCFALLGLGMTIIRFASAGF